MAGEGGVPDTPAQLRPTPLPIGAGDCELLCARLRAGLGPALPGPGPEQTANMLNSCRVYLVSEKAPAKNEAKPRKEESGLN